MGKQNAKTETKNETTGANGRTRPREEMGGEPVIHPMARVAAKHINQAKAKMLKLSEEERTPEMVIALAQTEAFVCIAETLGTAHYDAKGMLGLLHSGQGQAAEPEGDIDFS